MALSRSLLFVLLAPLSCADDSGRGADTLADVSDSDDASDDASDSSDSVDADTSIRPEVTDTVQIEPLDAPAGVWTWFDQPGSACSDGSETGFGVNRGSSNDVLVVMMGGGACWDFNGCFLFATATKGPIQKPQFDAAIADLSIGVLDRDDPDNPYRTWTQVFVPYCTGDLHAGERVMSYTSGGLTNTWHHSGAVNVRLMLPRLAATFPRPVHLVVSGISAGGFGATLQYPAFRAAFDAATSQLLDDSGPLLPGDAIPATTRSAWFLNWRLDLVVDPICGQACKQDLSLFYPELAERFPGDRLALVSSLQDGVVAAYFGLLPAAFETALRALAGDVLAPHAGWRTFLVAGNSHTTLGAPGDFSAQGIDLRGWLTRMVSGDADWESVAP